jgi:acetyl-CoA acyltransferase
MTEAYLCEGRRSPIGRFGGALAQTRPDDLLAHVIKSTLADAPSLDPAAIDDVIMGCANQAGEDNRNVARMAALLAGLPDSVAGVTINRLCGSGLDAVAMAARAIKLNEADVILAGGVESMTRAPFVMPKADSAYSRKSEIFDTTMGWRFVNEDMQARFGIDSMPETAENIAKDFSISRADQDAYAYRSQLRAAAAIRSGRFAREITPISLPQRKSDPVVFDTDEHPRATPLDKLANLATPFRKNGSVTAGNSSGVNDGAAAVIIASEAALSKYELKPLARIAGTAVVGVEPRIMGIGPAPATQKLLTRLGLQISDIGVIELNEAFAAQALAVMRQLGLADDAEHVNPNGGAIALGHPLGMSGARFALTEAHEIKAHGHKLALCTMCIGVGQGIAMMLEQV